MTTTLRLAIGAVLLGTMAIATPASAQTAAVTVTSPTFFNNDGPWTLGYSFTATQAQTVYALGAYDFGSDGFTAEHTVGLWDNSGNLLASTAVTGADFLFDGFRYANISALNLTIGSIYVVGASNFGTTDAYILSGTVTPATGVTFNEGRFAFGSGLLNPTSPNPAPLGSYFGANALLTPIGAAVPEPATWAMMLMGFGAMGFSLRRHKRVARLTQMA